MAFDLGSLGMQLGAGLLGGLFSKRPQYTPSQRLQQQIAQQLQQYSQGVPGSDPQEQAALAQMRGQLGAEQQQATGQVLGSLNSLAQTNVTDLLRNLSSSQAGERGALDIQALMQSLQAHRAALLQSAQVAGSVGPKGEPARGQDFPALFGNLAYQYSQQQAMKRNKGHAPISEAGDYGASLDRGSNPGQVIQNAKQPGFWQLAPAGSTVSIQSLPSQGTFTPTPAAPQSGLLNAFSGMIGNQIGGAQSFPGASQPTYGNEQPSFLAAPAGGYIGDALSRRLRGLG